MSDVPRLKDVRVTCAVCGMVTDFQTDDPGRICGTPCKRCSRLICSWEMTVTEHPTVDPDDYSVAEEHFRYICLHRLHHPGDEAWMRALSACSPEFQKEVTDVLLGLFTKCFDTSFVIVPVEDLVFDAGDDAGDGDDAPSEQGGDPS